jgi:hypothetical protein
LIFIKQNKSRDTGCLRRDKDKNNCFVTRNLIPIVSWAIYIFKKNERKSFCPLEQSHRRALWPCPILKDRRVASTMTLAKK